MQPIGPLMKEHRVIERMIDPIRRQLTLVEKNGQVDVLFATRLQDFIKTFADRCHHGKEEDILFVAMKKKDLSTELKSLIEELKEEHRRGRELTAQVGTARDTALNGKTKEAAEQMAEAFRGLLELYPPHIDKEDNRLFRPLMAYLSDEEKEHMLQQMEEEEKTILHEKYHEVMEYLEATGSA